MVEERGSHFDPELLDVFLTIVDNVVALQAVSSSSVLAAQ
jgi:response regulator RpfG family c-di-GMP phosphodiesterase